MGTFEKLVLNILQQIYDLHLPAACNIRSKDREAIALSSYLCLPAVLLSTEQTVTEGTSTPTRILQSVKFAWSNTGYTMLHVRDPSCHSPLVASNHRQSMLELLHALVYSY